MNAKHWIGWGLLAWGAIGLGNQLMLVQALGSGQAPTAALNSFDPAVVFGVGNPQGASYTSPGMLTDAVLTGMGAWLIWG